MYLTSRSSRRRYAPRLNSSVRRPTRWRQIEYNDLHIFPDKHSPSPYDDPVMIVDGNRFGDGYLPDGLSLYAIGWIEKKGFNTDPVSDDCIIALFNAHVDHIIWDGTRGFHTCTLCGISMPSVRWQDKVANLTGYGHYLV